MDEIKTTDAELLSVKQVAAVTGLSVTTIWRNSAKGTFPKPIKVCGSTRWPREAVHAVISGDAA